MVGALVKGVAVAKGIVAAEIGSGGPSTLLF